MSVSPMGSKAVSQGAFSQGAAPPRRGRRVRQLLGAFCVLALLVSAGAPAFASDRSMQAMMEGRDPVSPTFDLLVLRPVGMLGLVGGFGLFVVTSPITLITRPHEIGTPWERMVVQPARYVWMDELGQH